MKIDVKQNYGNHTPKLVDRDRKNTEQEGYVDDTDFGTEVTKRNPNLVDTNFDDDSDDDFDNDLDDDENNE